jgi:hypothetical protein
MKRASIAAMSIVLGAALASFASAQRHDEKPHGSKPSAQSQESQYEPMPGGRHDERPHGPRKKKADSKKPGAAETEKGGK